MIKTLLTSDDVAQWRSRLDEIEKEERALTKEKRTLLAKLDAVAVLVGDGFKASATTKRTQDAVVDSPKDTQPWGDRPSWPTEITRIFDEKKKHLSFDQLKIEIEKGVLKGEYALSDKGFYHAVARLQDRGYLIKHKGWLFRVSDYEEHIRKVEAGTIEDVSEFVSAHRKSPMGEEVKRFIEANPNGLSSADILAHLKEDSRFSETLTKNSTGAYNVISRLVKRGELRKKGRSLYPVNENEPPEGDSETEEGATSSATDERDAMRDAFILSP